MKKYTLILVVALFSSFFLSCSNDEASSTDNELVGIWRLTSLTSLTPVQVNGVATTDFTQIAADSQIEFNNNANGTMRYLTGLGFISETANENSEFNTTSGFVLFPFDFVLNNNIVTINESNTQLLNLTLNGDTLTLEQEGGIVTGNLENNTFEHITTIYVFTKQ